MIAGRLISLFENYVGRDCKWENLNKSNLAKLVDGFRAEVCINSAITYCRYFKATFNEFSDQIDLPEGYERILSLRKEATLSTWLNIEEIDRLIRYTPESEVEKLVVSQFILGCLTGARHSDFINFTEDNLTKSGTLIYVSQKTKVNTEIPIADAARRIILSGDAVGYVSDVTFNKRIRDIAKKCGIDERVQIFRAGEFKTGEKYKFIASHTARRSFATNLYLRCRDLFLVSKYMGHKQVDMTASYIMSIGQAPPEVMEYFEQFK